MQPLCKVCCSRGATESYELCRVCASAAYGGLWAATVECDGALVTTRGGVTESLQRLGWPTAGVQAYEPLDGQWLIPLPAEAVDLVLRDGWAFVRKSDAQGCVSVLVETP